MIAILRIIKDIICEKYPHIEYGICNFSALGPYINPNQFYKLPKNPKIVIVFLFPYYVNVGEHNISRYAIVPDYHKVCYKILYDISVLLKEHFINNNFKPFIDNSPIPEVLAGSLCGLGVVGKNNLLINKKYGSWIFIGEIVSDLKMYVKNQALNKCIGCNGCQVSCPAMALSDDKFDSKKCLSFITQKKGVLSSDESAILKNAKSVWGCDICQEVCPMNENAETSNISEFYDDIHEIIRLGDYEILSDRAFQWRKQDIIERNIQLVNIKS